MTQRGFRSYDGNHAPDYVKNGNFQLNQSSSQARGLIFWNSKIFPTLVVDPVGHQTEVHTSGAVIGPFGNTVLDSESASSQTAWPLNKPDVRSKTILTFSGWVITTSTGGTKSLIHRQNDNFYITSDTTGSLHRLVIGGCTAIDAVVTRTGIAHHLVGRMDGVNVTFFIDGINVGTQSDASAFPGSSSEIRIGDQSEVFKSCDHREYDIALTDKECFALFDPATRWDLYEETGRPDAVLGVAAAAAVAPRNPFGYPLYGPLAGPIMVG